MFGVLNATIFGLLLLDCFELGKITIARPWDAKFIDTCIGREKGRNVLQLTEKIGC